MKIGREIKGEGEKRIGERERKKKRWYYGVKKNVARCFCFFKKKCRYRGLSHY